MKKDIPAKGAILQRDRETYAIAPHIPGGITDTNSLRKICDIADKFGIKEIKLTSAQRLALFGVKEEDLDSIWDELEQTPGAAIGLCVRSVKICPGTTWCKRGVQDSVSLGLKIDAIYHAMVLPNKMKIGVSGCMVSCAETAVKDIGIMGTPKGWRIFVGGNAGARPRLADLLVDNLPSEQAVLETLDKIVTFYKNYPQEQRLGAIIDKIGLDQFRAGILGQ